tara:strand:- start:80 stop:724 length:645 start_codon:yes stop_codon:yes gene_type:complete
MAGASISEISSGKVEISKVRRQALVRSIGFSTGIVVVFVSLGAVTFEFSRMFRGFQSEFRIFAALFVILMGFHFIGVLRIPFFNKSFQISVGNISRMSIFSSFLVGVAFAAGWTPCVGGVLAAVIFTAANETTAFRGIFLLFAFGSAMCLPFVLATLFIKPFLTFSSRIKNFFPLIEKLIGLMLIFFAFLILTERMQLIAEWMVMNFPSFLLTL